MALEHLDWPYRVGVTVIQGTEAERKAAAGVLAATRRGAITDLPSFGVTTPLFSAQPVDADLMAREINEYEPRLSVTAKDIPDLAARASHVTVAVAAAEG